MGKCHQFQALFRLGEIVLITIPVNTEVHEPTVIIIRKLHLGIPLRKPKWEHVFLLHAHWTGTGIIVYEFKAMSTTMTGRLQFTTEAYGACLLLSLEEERK